MRVDDAAVPLGRATSFAGCCPGASTLGRLRESETMTVLLLPLLLLLLAGTPLLPLLPLLLPQLLLLLLLLPLPPLLLILVAAFTRTVVGALFNGFVSADDLSSHTSSTFERSIFLNSAIHCLRTAAASVRAVSEMSVDYGSGQE
jgi:hypothetical protein